MREISMDEAVQDAINAASDGHEVIVAPGTYYETINFVGKAGRLVKAVLGNSSGGSFGHLGAPSAEMW